MNFFLIAFFTLSIFLIPLTTLPLTLVVLVLILVLSKGFLAYLVAFIAGLVVDLLMLRHLGTTSLFFIIFLFILSLYQRKFEIKTVPFVFLSSFLGSIFYLRLFGYDNILLQSLISAFLAVLFFKLWLK